MLSTMSTPIQTQVEPDSEAPTAIYQVTTTPEPPNRGTCHVATPPEPEQAEIEAEPAATERRRDEELEVGSVEKLKEEEKGVEKQDGMSDREAERRELELVPSDVAINPVFTALASAVPVDPDPKPTALINPVSSNIAPNPSRATLAKTAPISPVPVDPATTLFNPIHVKPGPIDSIQIQDFYNLGVSINVNPSVSRVPVSPVCTTPVTPVHVDPVSPEVVNSTAFAVTTLALTTFFGHYFHRLDKIFCIFILEIF
jgi:hypothetical protein